MTRRWRWADAQEDAAALRPADGRTLALLARLPLMWTEAIAALSGLRGPAAVGRRLARLQMAGLVAAVRPASLAPRSPRLWHLTDLGLAVLALEQSQDPRDLARTWRVRRGDLLRALAGLPQLGGCYRLLAALANCRPGRPDLVAWERPWRRQLALPTAREPVRVELPAGCVLAWDTGETGVYLLFPDLGTVPLRAYRRTLGRLLGLRHRARGAAPLLVVAAPDRERADAWQRLLQQVSAAQREAPLQAAVVTWEDISRGSLSVVPSPGGTLLGAGGPVAPGRGRSYRPVQPAQEVPRPVGSPPSDSRSHAAVPLRLTRPQLALLDLVGRHPFLTAEQAAALLGWSAAWARKQCSALLALGLVRRLGELEVGERAARGLLELSPAGIDLVAAGHGLTPGEAARAIGLVGGGPERPCGPRQHLRDALAHTLGVNTTFVDLCAIARGLARQGKDVALVAWHNPVVCARGRMRPDGYGLLRYDGKRYGFFLEYDRGTEQGRDYRRKFAAYYAYLESGRYREDYEGFPTVLVIAPDLGPEARIAKALRAVGVGRERALPVLLTTAALLTRTPEGMFGRIWREPEQRVRRRWV